MIDCTPSQRRDAATPDVLRARQFDRYTDIIVEAAETVEDITIAQALDARGDASLADARRIISIFRAQEQSAEASRVLQLVTDKLLLAQRMDELEDTHVYATVPQRQQAIMAAGRAGLQALEASRGVRGHGSEVRDCG